MYNSHSSIDISAEFVTMCEKGDMTVDFGETEQRFSGVSLILYCFLVSSKASLTLTLISWMSRFFRCEFT